MKENDFFKELQNDGFKLISMSGKTKDSNFSKSFIIERKGYKVHAEITSRKGLILEYKVINVNF
jgi:hypothetical protein